MENSCQTLFAICSFCCCLIVFVCYSLWFLGPDADLIVSILEFTHEFWYFKTNTTLWRFFSRTVITKTCLFKYTKFLPPSNEHFQVKKSDILHISAEHIDCGYSLEPPRRGGPNAYPQSIEQK